MNKTAKSKWPNKRGETNKLLLRDSHKNQNICNIYTLIEHKKDLKLKQNIKTKIKCLLKAHISFVNSNFTKLHMLPIISYFYLKFLFNFLNKLKIYCK